jgi:hypothetical protein
MCWHKWDKWEEYEQPYSYTPGILSPRFIQGEILHSIEFRQKRICTKCGKVQDILIRD